MIDVIFKSYHPETPNKGYWDTGFIERIFDGKVWQPVGIDGFTIHDDFATLPSEATGAVVCIPARYHISKEDVAAINEDIAALDWVIMILSSDEETWFPLDQLKHPNMKVWATTPHPDLHKNIDGLLGEFMQYGAHDMLRDSQNRTNMAGRPKAFTVKKPLDYFFAGQITHDRRQKCAAVLINMHERDDMHGEAVFTEGFTQGLSPKDYYRKMAQAKTVPAPSGAVTPSSFRVFEALEAGAVPIADNVSPRADYPKGYWQFLFDGEHFPILEDYDQLPGYTMDVLTDYPHSANKVYAWWQGYKRDLVYKFADQLKELGAPLVASDSLRDKVTVLVVTSPIESHPSTAIIDETIATIRHHLPDCEIIIGIDGIRPEQEHYRKRYEAYKQQLLWRCNFEYGGNVLPIVFEEHMHQVAMTKQMLELVRTPTILFMEHDTPLCIDKEFEFDWASMVTTLTNGDLHVIRFHFEGRIPDEHKFLMLDEHPTDIGGVKYIRTRQWSQRPHLANASFYRLILEKNFSPDARTMIEDVMHGVVDDAVIRDGIMGWYIYRVAIYAPDESNLKRSYNLDGRKADPKYEMVF